MMTFEEATIGSCVKDDEGNLGIVFRTWRVALNGKREGGSVGVVFAVRGRETYATRRLDPETLTLISQAVRKD